MAVIAEPLHAVKPPVRKPEIDFERAWESLREEDRRQMWREFLADKSEEIADLAGVPISDHMLQHRDVMQPRPIAELCELWSEWRNAELALPLGRYSYWMYE